MISLITRSSLVITVPHSSALSNVAALSLPRRQNGLAPLPDGAARVNHSVVAVAIRQEIVPHGESTTDRRDLPMERAKIRGAASDRLLEVDEDGAPSLATRMPAPTAA